MSPIHPALRQFALEAAARRRQWANRRAEQSFLALAWMALGLTLAVGLAEPLAAGLAQAIAQPLVALAVGGGFGAVLLHAADRRDCERLAPVWLAALPVLPAQIAHAQRRLRWRRRFELAALGVVLPLLGGIGGLPLQQLPGLCGLTGGAWLLAVLLHLALPEWPARASGTGQLGRIASTTALSGTTRIKDGPLPILRLWQRRLAGNQRRRWLAWGWLLPVGILLPIGSGPISLVGLGLAGLGLSASFATLTQTQALLADVHRLLATQPLDPRRRRDAASLLPWRALLGAALAGGGGLALLGLPWPMAVGFGLILASASSYRMALSLRYPDQPGHQRRHALVAGTLGLLLLREAPPVALLLAPLAAGWQWRQAGR